MPHSFLSLRSSTDAILKKRNCPESWRTLDQEDHTKPLWKTCFGPHTSATHHSVVHKYSCSYFPFSQFSARHTYQQAHDKFVKKDHSDTSYSHLESHIYSFHVSEVAARSCFIVGNNLEKNVVISQLAKIKGWTNRQTMLCVHNIVISF